jgi:hypothetical protein
MQDENENLPNQNQEIQPIIQDSPQPELGDVPAPQVTSETEPTIEAQPPIQEEQVITQPIEIAETPAQPITPSEPIPAQPIEAPSPFDSSTTNMQNPQQIISVEPAKSKTSLVIAIVISVVILIGGGIAFAIWSQSSDSDDKKKDSDSSKADDDKNNPNEDSDDDDTDTSTVPQSPSTPTTPVTPATPTDDKGLYKSSKDGFSVKFPGEPTVNNTSSVTGDITIPITQYTYVTTTSNHSVQIAVSPQSLAGVEKDFLTSVLDGMAMGSGTTIESSKIGTYQGYTSLTATLSSSASTLRTLLFIKGRNIYIISTFGTSKAQHDSFVSSFKLN